MRSEAEIRREVERRFHRWFYLLLNGGLWIATGIGLYLYTRMQDVPHGWTGSVVVVLMLWGIAVGLHFLRTLYVETREWLVRRAIDRERQYYRMDNAYEKRKRTDALPPHSVEDALIDFPAANEESIANVPVKRERR